MDTEASFGRWLRRQRRALDLTQEELAQRVRCSVVTIRKIESDERRPSKQIAAALADCLNIAASERAAYIAFARGKPYDTTLPTQPPPADWVLEPTAHRRAVNLPAPLTALFGRDQDIAAARNYLLRDEARLLTLIGPPGIGKTRLSIQLATDLIDMFADGICFVGLAPIHDPQLVVPTIAQALGVKETSDQPLNKRLADYLRDKHMLLVLDNFEQVLAAAALVAEVLAASPRLKLLITSRAPLHIRGERRFPVPPLLLPNLTDLPAVQQLAEYPSVALFVERAHAIDPDFALSEANASLVATICARLDGLPLAIELAAARSKLLPPQELLARLDRRLIVLTDGPRDLPARHVTLRAAIGWSYDLLGAREQTLLARLAVFVGGFTLDAAEAICRDRRLQIAASRLEQPDQATIYYLQSAILEGLASLVNNSLVVQQTQADGSARLTMLETIRQFALEKLLDSGEETVMPGRHRDWYMALAEQAEAEWGRPQQEAWLDRLEADYDNLRAALESSKSQPGALEAGLRLATALWLFWDMRGYLREGCTRLAELLELADESVSARVCVRARTALGYLIFQQGDYNTAAALLEASVVQARALGDKQILAIALDRLGLLILRSEADPVRAQAIIEEGLSLGRKMGDPRVVYSSIFYLADLAQAQGQYGQALQLYEESLSLMRRHGDRWHVALALFSLGHLAWLQHDDRRAQASFIESLDLRWQLKDKRGIAFCFDGLAWVAATQGQAERAARLFGAAEVMLAAIGAVLHPVRHAAHEQTIGMARTQLGAVVFDQAWMEGRMMSAEQALAYALGR